MFASYTLKMNVGIVGSVCNIDRHLKPLKENGLIRLIGVHAAPANRMTGSHSDHVIFYADPKELLDQSDAIVVTDPGRNNYSLAVLALRKARHVFLCPGIVRSPGDALQLITLAREANVILRVGSLGPYNVKALADAIPEVTDAKLIELHYNQKIREDLSEQLICEALILNLQVIYGFGGKNLLSLKVKGMSMLTGQPEIISTRLEFTNGLAANITCNLVAAQDDFQGIFILKDRCLKYNFISQKLTSWDIRRTDQINDTPLHINSSVIGNQNLLSSEVNEFISQIASGSKSLVANDYGFESFFMAERILEKVRKSVILYS